ncbi:hypothetical protein JKP88DRAFT_260647 [Tribonema minus]|uniref:ATP-binding protein n=1 Tax=Tribonema minus TaxID=303371 RepID=A0A836CFE5_9STRA|nr:hypothetical protein JKP88DRAFT_260647 [Tribonema minus]
MLNVREIAVLVSPTAFMQRQRHYQGRPGITVYPLLFDWNEITAKQLKALMGVSGGCGGGAAPLYMHVLLGMLRDYQRHDHKPSFEQFASVCLSKETGFSGTQRGMMVVADLTDPMLAPDEANCIFQVLLEQFRCAPFNCKLAVFDEAHKYLGDTVGGNAGGGLAGEMVNVFRLMRHQGMRMVISTQSPAVLPEEMLELVTVAVVHSCQSQDWLRMLNRKLALHPDRFNEVMTLDPGHALVFARKAVLGQGGLELATAAGGSSLAPWYRIAVRRRLTRDGGVSVTRSTGRDRGSLSPPATI